MDITLLEKSKDQTKLSFILKGVDAAYANSLRRYMINKVPTMAIEEVEFRKNSSALYDEVVAHRLGLIPFKTDLKSYNLPSECKCKGAGCAQCQLKITLKAKGPKIVLSSQLKSKDPKVEPVSPDMPIVELLKDQELEFVATAVLGVGKDHIKWSPGLVYYRHKPKVTINKNSFDEAEDAAKKCPVNVFEFKNNKITVDNDNLLKCTLCNACTDACKHGEIQVEPEKDTFIFTIESWGQLSCKEMVKESVKVFDKAIEELNEKIKEIKTE